MNKLGYIVEVRKNYSIIMTEDGEFTKIKTKPGMLQGLLIDYTEEQIYIKKIKPIVWLASSVAAVLIFIMVFLFIKQLNSFNTFMYVDIDINPSVEFSVDINGTIMEAQPLNTDGKMLINELKLKGTNLKEGLKKVFDKSVEYGFIYHENENDVLISACIEPGSRDKRVEDDVIDNILSPIKQMKLSGYNIKIKVIKVLPEDRKEAVANDLSMGRYEMYKYAHKDRSNLTLVQVKNSSISDLLSKVQIPEDEKETPVQTSAANESVNSVTGAPIVTKTPPTPVNSYITMNPAGRSTTTPLYTLTPKQTPEPTDIQFNGTGLRGEYYDNLDLTNLKTVKIDSDMDLNWNTNPPMEIKNDGSYSARWQGKLQAVFSEEYTFYVTRDNGVRLWVDNELIIDQWNNQCSVTDTAKVNLKAGEKYDIVLEYYNNSGFSYVKLEWSSPSTKRAVIPSKCLYPSSKTIPSPPTLPGNGTGLKGEYFDNSDLTGLKLTEVDPFINFNWGVGSPDKVIKDDSKFSVRWTGKIEPHYSEEYTFYLTYDDGVKVWVNNILLLDYWTTANSSKKSAIIKLEAGKKYNIKVEYRNTGQWGKVKLEWSSANTKKMVVPKSCLYPS